jgi:hypothetical protein
MTDDNVGTPLPAGFDDRRSICGCVGIQTWFLVTGISCTLMGMLGFLSTDVMQLEGRTTENTRPGHKASGKEGCEVS